MSSCDKAKGFIDVKISSKSKRGFTPWKAWQKQWCEIQRLDTVENGVVLKLKSSEAGMVLDKVFLPRSATICRTDSRTKQYAFGVFNLGRKKPLLYLSGVSESDSQEWMRSIRKMLCIATFLPVGQSNFTVSLVDNSHSKAAGLVGLYGVLTANSQEILISDPCTGNRKVSFKWFQFHQFHLQAHTRPNDDGKVVVMHTSGEFPSGPGQLYLYCNDGSKLLHYLISRGKTLNNSTGLLSIKRLSRSEGDLFNAQNTVCSPDSPICFRSQTGSEDSGVRVSIASDDSDFALKSKNASSVMSIGIALITKTPGGSETESTQDLEKVEEVFQKQKGKLLRNESGISLSSGIYEEIPDGPYERKQKDLMYKSHVYENPIDIILMEKKRNHFMPPPLPPRRPETRSESEVKSIISSISPFKPRCNTLPAKDLSKMSQIFTSESEYVVMSPGKIAEKKKCIVSESFYMPMSPARNPNTNITESHYIAMNGRSS